MILLRSSSCCARSASVLDTIRGMTFMAESHAATNPFSFSCAIGLSESSCSATCSFALMDSSASLRQRETLDPACSPVSRTVGLVGPGNAGESVPMLACGGCRTCKDSSLKWQWCNRRSASTTRKVVSRYATSKLSIAPALVGREGSYHQKHVERRSVASSLGASPMPSVYRQHPNKRPCRRHDGFCVARVTTIPASISPSERS